MPDGWNPRDQSIPLKRAYEIFVPNVTAVDMDTTGTWPYGFRPTIRWPHVSSASSSITPATAARRNARSNRSTTRRSGTPCRSSRRRRRIRCTTTSGICHRSRIARSRLRQATASNRARCRSRRNGPPGTTAAAMPAAASAGEIGTFRMASSSIITSATKRHPCSEPTMRTASGMPAKYLSGMAIPKRTRVEIPSTRAPEPEAACRAHQGATRADVTL